MLRYLVAEAIFSAGFAHSFSPQRSMKVEQNLGQHVAFHVLHVFLRDIGYLFNIFREAFLFTVEINKGLCRTNPKYWGTCRKALHTPFDRAPSRASKSFAISKLYVLS
jgi:hypothetical protein